MKIELTLPPYQDIVSRVSLNETNDCAVLALSRATWTSYVAAHAALKRCGRKDQEGTPVGVTMRAAELLGWFCESRWLKDDATVAYVLKQNRLRFHRLLVILDSHIFAVVGGAPYDSNPLDTQASVIGVLSLCRKAELAEHPCRLLAQSSIAHQTA